MADEHAEAHAGPDFALYLKVFGALVVCTALSFLANWLLGQNASSMAIIMVVAVIKAVLVVMIFMHLKFDWSKLYFIVIPVLILAVMMMIVLLPDIVLAWHH
jgi:caa(3)-type oxidase subunit IV